MNTFLSNPWNLGYLGYLLFVVLITIGLIIYFLPTIIADHRKKKQFLAIRLLNIFAGWTFIGWISCLIWASLKEKSDEINDQSEEITESNPTMQEAFEIPETITEANVMNGGNNLDDIPEGTILTGRYKGQIVERKDAQSDLEKAVEKVDSVKEIDASSIDDIPEGIILTGRYRVQAVERIVEKPVEKKKKKSILDILNKKLW